LLFSTLAGEFSLLRLRFDLYLHAFQHEYTNKARLSHHDVRGRSRPLEYVMEEPRLSASED
jgi:hypothetical protein